MQSVARISKLVLSILSCSVALLVASGCSTAETFSPYSEFLSMSLADMDSLRVKLSYGGPQDAMVNTIVLAGIATSIQMSAFAPYRRAGFEYTNDDLPIAIVRTTRQELRAIIDSVGTVPDVTDGNVDVPERLSFALLSTAAGTTKVFEAVVNQSSGRQLFGKLLLALRSNGAAVQLLRMMGCDVAMMPPELPAAAGNLAKVTFDGLRPDRRTKGLFVGKVRVRNTSSGVLPGPVSLIVARVGGNASLVEADGTTCLLSPPGDFFIDLPVGAGLPAGASIERILHFSNPSLTKFDVQFRVFYGPGSR